MARPSNTSLGSYQDDHVEAASIELTSLLRRLQDSVLHPTPERERLLRRSELERAKLDSNLKYARASLAKLEQDVSTVKAPAKRSEVHGALGPQREMLDLLLDRLDDLNRVAEDDDDDNEDEEQDTDSENVIDDILLMTVERADLSKIEEQEKEIVQPISVAKQIEPEQLPAQPNITPSDTNRTAPPPPATTTSQTLRPRRTEQSPSQSSTLPLSSYTSARAALFANRRHPAEPQTSTATAEAILDQQRQEQDALSEAILKMAGALKSSSQNFSNTLEADKEVLGRAGEGIEKTERSMESAKGRMGTLRRMTEGKGWWGRIILYAWVYGLMLSLLLLVFVFPKLRF